MKPGLVIKAQKDRHIGHWLVALIIAIVIIGTGWYGYNWYTHGAALPVDIPAAKADPSVDESAVSKQDIDAYAVPAANPRYISIPALNVENTRVYGVGVTAQNILESPRNIHDAAWYKKSQTPGTGYGAVLINAHNGGITKNGVFAELNTLTPGDRITVERGDGKKISYRVVELKTMSLQEINDTGMKTMMQSIEPSKEGLSLITCAGKWVPRLNQFDQRITLRAVAEAH